MHESAPAPPGGRRCRTRQTVLRSWAMSATVAQPGRGPGQGLAKPAVLGVEVGRSRVGPVPQEPDPLCGRVSGSLPGVGLERLIRRSNDAILAAAVVAGHGGLSAVRGLSFSSGTWPSLGQAAACDRRPRGGHEALRGGAHMRGPGRSWITTSRRGRESRTGRAYVPGRSGQIPSAALWACGRSGRRFGPLRPEKPANSSPAMSAPGSRRTA